MSKQGVNRIILIGNLGADPEERATKEGRPVCNLRVATSEKYKGEEHTEWHRIVVFGEQASACAKYLKKGRSVYVEGRLRSRTWVDKDQNKRFSVDVIGERVVFLSGGGDGDGPPPAKSGSKPANDNAAPWDDRKDLPAVDGDDDIPF